jgi:hypothetical protein
MCRDKKRGHAAWREYFYASARDRPNARHEHHGRL